jgi:hypothetical protein
MVGSCHHPFQILIHATILYGDFLKVTLCRNNLHTIQELKQYTLAAMISIIEETLAQIVKNFQHHLQMVMDTNGAHIENPFI